MQFLGFLLFSLSLVINAVVTALPTVPSDASGVDTSVFGRRQVPSLPCSHLTGGVHVIAASGDGAANNGIYGLIGSLATSILIAIPGSTNVTLPYDKASNMGVAKTTGGAQNLLQYVTDYHQYCPRTRIVLLGYSAGAIITMNTLCGASPLPWQPTPPLSYANFGKRVIAAVVYGDETFVANPRAPYDRGTCTTNGRFPRNNSACPDWAGKIQSYCDGNDPQCCSGFDASVHYTYPQKYDVNATQFVVSQRNKYGV